MALQPQPISWNLTGGLAGDSNPLSVQPGSHLRLDDVKQERADEWRARQGFDAVTMSPGPVMVGPNADGQVVYLADTDGDVMRFYDPATSTTSYGTSYRDRPADWERMPVNALGNVGVPVALDCATTSTTVMSMTGHGNTFNFAVYSKATKGQVAGFITVGPTLGGSNVLRGKLGSIGDTYVAVFVTAAGAVTTMVYDANGTFKRTDNVFAAASVASPFVDVLYYSGSTITIVALNNANQAQFIEYNPTTGSTATANLSLGVAAQNYLGLLSDPDSSGTRYVALSNTTPSTRVLRVTSAGVVSSNEQAEAIASTQIAGVAYTSGTEWQIVYQTSGGIKGCKKSTTIGSPVFVGGTARTDMAMRSASWREPGTDPMRVLLAIHVTAANETQDTYLEYSFSFTGGNVFTSNEEPQSILLPLDAWNGSGTVAQLTRVVRDSARSYWVSLMRAANSTLNVVDLWHAQYPASAAGNVGALSVGRPVQCAGSTWFPSGVLFALEPGPCPSLGVPFFPRAISSVSQSTTGPGGMTLLATYQYVVILVVYDSEGRIWRSPLSEPVSITLTGTNNTVSFTFDQTTMPCIASASQARTINAQVYRTAGNGSVFQLNSSFNLISAGTTPVTWSDVMSDAFLASGTFAYTNVELETAITPRPAYIATYGDRMWLVNADFRTELWFTKHIRPGHQPEFVDEFVIDFDDEFGDITGIAQLDDKLVVFKRNAIYLVAGDGPEDNGSGSLHSTARVSMDVGAIIGPPTISTGEEVFFVSERGIFSIDRSARVSWVGSPVDDFFCQPTVRTPITVTDIVFVRAKNEVRFLYSGGQLVYDRKHQIWYRWTGGLSNYTLSAVVGGNQMLFKSTGALVENASSTTDAGTTYRGTIRSAWVRAGQFGTQMRLYRAFVTGAQIGTNTGVAPKLTIFQNNSDDPVQSFEPANPFPSTESPIQAEARPGHGRQNCAAFSLQIELPASDGTWRLEQWGAVVGVRGGAEKRPATERWT